MLGLIKPLAAVIALLAVQAHPFPIFGFSDNPAYVVKRALFKLDNLTDQSQKDKLTQGLKDAVTVAAKVLEKMDDPKHTDKLAGWFGAEKSDASGRKTVKTVFENFVGTNPDGTGADILANVIVYADDYWKPKKAPGDGKTGFCDVKTSDGKTGAAYYGPRNSHPGMHYCDKVFTRGDLAGLTSDSCGNLGDIMDTVRMTKQFIGANVLHEFMHFPSVGAPVPGGQIGDVVYDAYNCRVLATNTDVNERAKTILNADTYVWYALHIALDEFCGKEFSYPKDTNDNDPDNPPAGDISDDEPADEDPGPPATGPCNCNESGCTPDSPSCCANGTC